MPLLTRNVLRYESVPVKEGTKPRTRLGSQEFPQLPARAAPGCTVRPAVQSNNIFIGGSGCANS